MYRPILLLTLSLPFIICGAVQWNHTLSASAARQPAQVEARTAPILTVNNLKFRDLNKNGKLDVYEDWQQPSQARASMKAI